MDERKPTIKKLSQAVLDLKFMKKSKEKARIEEDNEERQILYKDQLLALPNSADRVVQIGSYFDVMEYLPCRLSFGGMEPNIEKLNIGKLKGLYEITKEEPEEVEDADVSKEEMAEHFSSLNQTIGKKFNKRPGHQEFIPPNKRKRRGQFIKPEQ